MLDKARQKIARKNTRRPIDLKAADLHQELYMENASVVTMLLTLQFIRPLYRERVMNMIHSGLNEQGCLLLIEKLTSEDTIFNRLFIQHYYDFKRRNGYSDSRNRQETRSIGKRTDPLSAGRKSSPPEGNWVSARRSLFPLVQFLRDRRCKIRRSEWEHFRRFRKDKAPI